MTTTMSRSAVDPRLRRRRIEVQRAQGRRRLKWAAAVLAVVLAGVGVYSLTKSRFLDLDAVEIGGVSVQRQAMVEGAVTVELGTPLVDLDTAQIAASVSALPWVHSVEVRRRWPSSLHIDVTERTPVAVLPDGRGGLVLVDSEGIAMATARFQTGTRLPLIDVVATGVLGDEQTAVLGALAVVDAMPADLAPWVDAVTLSADQRLGIDLTGSARAELGDASHAADKLAALRSVLASVELRCIDVIDVRVADLATVRRDPVCVLDTLQ